MILRPLRKTAYARRTRDFGYLKWLRGQPCFLCGRRLFIEAAHVGIRALGRKCSDRECVPACHWCHRTSPSSLHRLGKLFWSRHNLDRVELVTRYQKLYAEHKDRAA